MKIVRQIDSLTQDGAMAMLQAAMDKARGMNAAVAICIMDARGLVLASTCDERARLGSPNMAKCKAKTALWEQRSTTVCQEHAHARASAGLPPMHKFDGYMPVPGGFVVTSKGTVCGSVGVSGADKAHQDEEIGEAALEAFREALSDG